MNQVIYLIMCCIDIAIITEYILPSIHYRWRKVRKKKTIRSMDYTMNGQESLTICNSATNRSPRLDYILLHSSFSYSTNRSLRRATNSIKCLKNLLLMTYSLPLTTYDLNSPISLPFSQLFELLVSRRSGNTYLRVGFVLQRK
jgi:hypothetical protein